MAKKLKQKLYQFFESCFENGKFTKISENMQESKAWDELSISQIGLYQVLKRKFTFNKKDGTYNTNDISMPKSEWIKYYSKKIVFDKDMDNLINLGFIKVIIYQGNLRKATIYGFTDQWKYYKTDKFNVTDKDKRPKDTLSKEHKKAISEGSKKSNAERYTQKVIELHKNYLANDKSH